MTREPTADIHSLAADPGGRPLRLPLTVLVVLCLLGWVVSLGALTGRSGWAGALVAFLTDAPVTVLIFLSAGGWGYWAIRPLLPRDTPTGLKVVTSVAVGLWLVSTAVLAIGSAVQGALTPYVWWPVVGAGLVAGVLPMRHRLMDIRLPARVGGLSLLWVVAAMAAGVWIAGATIPPGLVGRATGDFYDVVSYHLQVPREYYTAGRIHELPHNTYSYYPLGGEMLFLLAMCLKGGAYPGVYVAKFTHGLWGVLAVAAVYVTIPSERTLWRRAAAVLLASTPWVMYLSWLAFVELAELAYMAVGLAWLLRWARQPCWRAAAMMGLAAGGACAAKYLSVGLVAAPLLGVMLLCALPRPRRLTHVLLAGVLCLAMAGPWLIRDYAQTGNPVFPLASGVFGRGHWSAASAELWDRAHAPPPLGERPAGIARMLLPEAYGLRDASFGPLLWVLFAAGAAVTIIRGRRGGRTEWMCLGVFVLQFAAWATATHMPWRFLFPAAVPMVILASGFVDWLGRLGAAPRDPGAAARPGGLLVAATVLLAAAGANLASGWRLYEYEGIGGLRFNGWEMTELPRQLPGVGDVYEHLGKGGRLMMVGDVRPFLFPANTQYQSVWQGGPLVEIARQTRDPHEIIRRLESPPLNITLVLVHWDEIRRLRRTYGWWEQVDEGLIQSLIAAGARPVEQVTGDDGRMILQLLGLPRLSSESSTAPATPAGGA